SKASSTAEAAAEGQSEFDSQPTSNEPASLPPVDGEGQEMDTLPSPDDTSPMPPADGSDVTPSDSAGSDSADLEAPEPPEAGGSASLPGPSGGWQRASD